MASVGKVKLTCLIAVLALVLIISRIYDHHEKTQRHLKIASNKNEAISLHMESSPMTTDNTATKHSPAAPTDTVSSAQDNFRPTSNLTTNSTRYFDGKERLQNTMQPSGGYILSHDYWEQLTSATRNLQSLQCWAGKLAMSVVEPSVKGSSLRSPTLQTEEENSLKFSDIYDIDHWNALGHTNAPLIPWKEFLKRAPRNLITVNFKYGASSHGPVQQGSGPYREGCNKKNSWINLVNLLKQHNFKPVRQICINFSYNKRFSLDEFYKEVFGDYHPSSSTLLFGQWKGLGIYRVQVTNSDCSKVTGHVDSEPSKRMIRDAEKYIKKYMKTPNYVAIMARMEKARKQKDQNGKVTNCFQLTVKQWEKMVKETGTDKTFLSTDVGKYGSHSFKGAVDDLDIAFRKFVNTIYSDDLTIRQWESTFESVSGLFDAGYIGMLQKVLASRAKCLLLVGGGSYQKNALQLYKKQHSKNEQCVYVVRDCIDDKFLNSM